MKWTNNKVSKLIVGWNQGLTGGDLTRELGATRNAIMGKIFRLRKAGYALQERRLDDDKPPRRPAGAERRVA